LANNENINGLETKKWSLFYPIWKIQ